MHLESIAMQIGACLVVEQTVADDELKVRSERVKRCIAMTVDLLTHSAQVHWMTNLVQVVHNLATDSTPLHSQSI